MKKILEFIDTKTSYVFWMIMAVQIVVILILGGLKSNYHQDEIYTFDGAHYMADTTPSNRYMYKTEQFSTNEWMEIKDFKGLLTVGKEESLFNDSIISFCKKMVFKNPYECLLNIVETVFTPGYISKWSGILLSLPFVILGQWALYQLTLGITDKKWALLAVIFYGFSGMSLSYSVYIRFYCFTIAMIMVSAYLHYRMWKSNSIAGIVISEIIAYGCLLEAFLCSQLVAVIIIAIYLCYLGLVLVKRKWKNVIIHIIPVIVGLNIFLAPFVSYYKSLLNNPDKIKVGSPAFLIRNNLQTLCLRELAKRTYNYFVYLGDNLFGSYIVLALVCIFAAILFIIICCGKIKDRKNREARDDKDDRKDKEDRKEMQTDSFAIVIIGTAFIYSMFAILAALWLPRYHGIGYSLIAVSLIVLFRCLLNGQKDIFKYAATVFLALAILLTPVLGHIDNVFYYEKDMVNMLATSDVKDNVIWNLEDYQIIEECVYLRDDSCRMFVVNENAALPYECFEEEFYLWITERETLSEEEIGIMKENGYEIAEFFGKLQDANIYYCKRME